MSIKPEPQDILAGHTPERITACMTALEGISDPAAFVEAYNKMLIQLHKARGALKLAMDWMLEQEGECLHHHLLPIDQALIVAAGALK